MQRDKIKRKLSKLPSILASMHKMNSKRAKLNQIIHCKWLINNPKFSDVQFLVGPNMDLVYAHKMVLASGSPVFENYFYADHGLKMNGEPIEVPDLTTIGFLNMIKFLYGTDVSDLDQSDFVETYMAADKYIVNELTYQIPKYLRSMLKISNSCFIYDTLLKLPYSDDFLLTDVLRMIQNNTAEAFESRSHAKIDLYTFSRILRLDKLNINEISILKACLRWAQMECSKHGMQPNPENIREIFNPIKSLICFTNLSIVQVTGFGEIEKLLDKDEIDSLVSHLRNKSEKLAIECKPQRQRCQAYTAKDNGTLTHVGITFFVLRFVLSVNHHVSINWICTHQPKEVEDLSLLVNDTVTSAQKILVDGKWGFYFNKYLQVAPNQDVILTFESNSLSSMLSMNTLLVANDAKKTKFQIKTASQMCHCIKRIEFFS